MGEAGMGEGGADEGRMRARWAPSGEDRAPHPLRSDPFPLNGP